MRRIRVLVCVLPCLLAAACGSAEAAQTPQTTPATEVATIAPTLTPTAAQPTEAPTPSGPLGSIAGKIIQPYPDVPVPAARVYTHEVNTGRISSVELAAGQTDYKIQNLPVGAYEIVGWFFPQGTSGAHTSSKLTAPQTSGDQLKCNTSLVRVTLKSGQMDVTGIDINCWGGDFFYLITPAP